MARRLSNEEKCNRLIRSLKDAESDMNRSFREEIKDFEKSVGRKIRKDEEVYAKLTEVFDEYKDEIHKQIQDIIRCRDAGEPPPDIPSIGVTGIDSIIKANKITLDFLVQKVKSEIKPLSEQDKRLLKTLDYNGNEMIEIDIAELGNVPRMLKSKIKKEQDKRLQRWILLGIGLIILLFFLLSHL